MPRTNLKISYVTAVTLGNLWIEEILKQSREDGVVWVFTHEYFKTILWNGLNAGDLVGYRARIDAMNLVNAYIGITDKNEIWFYVGDDTTALIRILWDQNWIVITDADTGTFDGTELSMTTYLTYPAYTNDQKEIATYLFQVLAEGMVAYEGVTHWFVASKDFVKLDERYSYVYYEGETHYADLPPGVKTVAFFRMIEGRRNLIQIRGTNGEIFDSFMNPDLRFNWKITKIAQPIAPTPGN